MLKIIQAIIKPKAPKRPTVADCVAAQAILDAKLAVLLPKELQVLTLEQWRTFIQETVKPVEPVEPVEPVDQPQSVAYTLQDGTTVVVAGVVPPLTLVGDYSSTAGYVEFKDKLGTLHRVAVQKSSIPADS